MSIQKKNIIILVLLDIAYVLLSINVVLSYYLTDTASWYAYIPFVLILTLGLTGFLIYRRKSEALLPISKTQYLLTRVLTVTFLIVYVLQMIIIPNPQEYQASLSIGMGSFLAAIGLSALLLHLYILLKGFNK